MDNNENALDVLVKSITSTCKKLISKANFDRTYDGVIASVNSDGYTVKYAGTSVNVKTTATGMYKVGDMVKICIPCGNKRNCYIVNKLENFQDMFKLVRISLKTSTISSGAAVNIFPSSFTAPDTNIYQCLGFIVWDTYSQHLVPQCVSTFSFYARNVSSSSITVSASAYGILLYAKKTYVS